MTGSLNGRRIAFIATDGVEEVELTDPWNALSEASAKVSLISIEPGRIQGYNHLDPAEEHDVDLTSSDASVDDFDALVLPGGVANPDRLRTDAATVGLVRDFVEAGKPVGVICHGPWTLIEADIVRGRHLTSWPSLRTDLVNAGAEWTDEEVVVCESGPNTLVSSRNPGDLPAFCRELVERFRDLSTERSTASAR